MKLQVNIRCGKSTRDISATYALRIMEVVVKVVVYAELSEYHVFPLLFRRRPSAVVSKRAHSIFFVNYLNPGGSLTRQARLFLAYSTESVVGKERPYSWYGYCWDASYQFDLGSFLTYSPYNQKIVTVSVVRSVVPVQKIKGSIFWVYLIYGMLKRNTSISQTKFFRWNGFLQIDNQLLGKLRLSVCKKLWKSSSDLQKRWKFDWHATTGNWSNGRTYHLRLSSALYWKFYYFLGRRGLDRIPYTVSLSCLINAE